MPSSVRRTIPSASSVRRRSRSSIADDGGNFGAVPKPPKAGSYSRWSPRSAAVEQGRRQLPVAGLEPRRAPERRDELLGLRLEIAALLAPRRRDRLEQLGEARQAMPRLRGEVRARVERPPVRAS